jgi:hypothetical protein
MTRFGLPGGVPLDPSWPTPQLPTHLQCPVCNRIRPRGEEHDADGCLIAEQRRLSRRLWAEMSESERAGLTPPA